MYFCPCIWNFFWLDLKCYMLCLSSVEYGHGRATQNQKLHLSHSYLLAFLSREQCNNVINSAQVYTILYLLSQLTKCKLYNGQWCNLLIHVKFLPLFTTFEWTRRCDGVRYHREPDQYNKNFRYLQHMQVISQ